MTERTVASTIVARNYLPYVRLLAAGWRRHHPDLALVALVIDAEPDERGEPAPDGVTILAPAQLGLDPGELGRLRGIYGIAELSTALKPHLLRHLLDDGADVVLHLDADTDVHGPLDHVADLARAHGVVLTAHVLEPVPQDGLSPSESELGWGGMYNSGVIAVGNSARPFLDWWSDRVRRDCLFCEPMGMHADQRWLELVPSYFAHHILRDPGVNVAHWNLHERRIGRDRDGAFTVNDEPLRVFHFSGYDTAIPERPGPDGWPRPLRFDMASEPELAALCRDYGARLEAAGHAAAKAAGYGHARSAGGTVLGRWERLAYRELVIAAEALGRDIPDPFDPARSAEFERLIADPAASGLLSPAARYRVVDARLADAAPIGSRPEPVRLARQVARRLPIRRHAWMPWPLPSDRTRLEYATPARSRPFAPAAVAA